MTVAAFFAILSGPALHFWIQSGTPWIRYSSHALVFVAVFLFLVTWGGVSAFDSIEAYLS